MMSEGKCSRCKKPIVFLRSKSGGLYPCNPLQVEVIVATGQFDSKNKAPIFERRAGFLPHWVECPSAKEGV